MNWLQSILLGLASGFVELVPVSAEAHRIVFLTMAGATELLPAFSLATRIGTMLTLILACLPEMLRMHRERRIAAVPPKRRKRQPDAMALYELRFLRTAFWPVLLSGAVLFLPRGEVSLWGLALGLLCSGIWVFLPRLFPYGNKNAGNVSALDSILLGAGCALAVLPGFSAISGCMPAGQLRGMNRSFLLRMTLLLCMGSLLVLGIGDAVALFSMDATLLSGTLAVHCLLAGLAAFAGAWGAIALMRHLAVHIGFDSFAFYSWGAALFTFILFLTI